MDLNPPAGSKISVSYEGGNPTIIIPSAASSSRYFGGAFLLFWLGGWAMGFQHAVSEILSGKGSAFLVFWLGAWTIGGLMAGYTVFRIFRPPVSETLELKRTGIAYDSGISPPQFDSWNKIRNTSDRWKSAFPRRVSAELDRRQLQSLRLRETEAGNRLTVDVDAERIDIASGASEVEREWLARLLASRYALPQISANASGNEP